MLLYITWSLSIFAELVIIFNNEDILEISITKHCKQL